MKITSSAKALIITLLFRMIFGGYLMGKDQFLFNDSGSALQVLIIYGLIGILATLFLLGKRYGLLALIYFDAIFFITQIVFTILALTGTIDPGLHGPVANWWGATLMLAFSILTITFAVKAYREIGSSSTHVSLK